MADPMRYDVTTAIPYVNGRPHVGHALELVQTDVLARHRRQRGDEVRFQSGTDDNALKNVRAAEAEFDFRRAVEVVTALGDEANRFVEAARPWELAKAERTGATPQALDAVLVELISACRDIAEHLTPFLPAAAARIAHQTGDSGDILPPPSVVFPRLEG